MSITPLCNSVSSVVDETLFVDADSPQRPLNRLAA